MNIETTVPALRVRFHGLAYGGEAVGRSPEGMAIFVPYGAPEEEAEVAVTERHRNFLRGRLGRLTSPSPDRVPPPCPHFGECGGCQLQHLSYEAQLREKTRWVKDALARIGRVANPPVRDCLAAPAPWSYRHKATFVFAAGECGGFYAARSHRVVEVETCPIQHPVSNAVLAAVKELVAEGLLTAHDPSTGRGLLRWLETRVNAAGNQAVATLGTAAASWPEEAACAAGLLGRVPALTGVLCRAAARQEPEWSHARASAGDRHAGRDAPRVLAGDPYLEEEIAGCRWRVHAASFFQVNPLAAGLLFEQVRRYAGAPAGEGAGGTVVDAYGGVGFLARAAAGPGATVVVVESSPLAAADAEANLRASAGAGAVVLRERVERALPRLRRQGLRPDVVILDPPRSGAREALAALAALAPPRIVYVSCDPATLARDVADLGARGYALREAQPLDMFPQSFHVECVCLLEAAGPRS